MAFKQPKNSISFADISLFTSVEKNKAIKRMEQINKTIDWENIEKIIMENYPVGKSNRGNGAYQPIVLIKCLLLQKWFRISSDPELETQINDRISFKKFLNIALDEPAPDHSTFCRFRERLSKNTMRLINNEILKQFAQKGLTINKGVAVDARLVQSASRPISNEKLEAERQKRSTPEGNLDKNENPIKFSRDIDSDWTIKNDSPHFGLKEHASVDSDHGFVLALEITPASHHDSLYLPLCVAMSRHTDTPIGIVYADKGYPGKNNRKFLHLNNIVDGIMRKAVRGTDLTVFEKERNKGIAKFRYIVEQYFGLSHLHNQAFRARFTKLRQNAIDAFCRQMAFNISIGTRIFAT